MKELAFEINGIKIYSDVDCLKTYEQLIDLPLMARLFSWPWKPWKKTYSIKVTVADPMMHMIYEDGKLIGIVTHPDTVKTLSQTILDKISEKAQKM